MTNRCCWFLYAWSNATQQLTNGFHKLLTTCICSCAHQQVFFFLSEWSALSPRWLVIRQRLCDCGISLKDKETWERIRRGHTNTSNFITPVNECFIYWSCSRGDRAFYPITTWLWGGTFGVALIKQKELILSQTTRNLKQSNSLWKKCSSSQNWLSLSTAVNCLIRSERWTVSAPPGAELCSSSCQRRGNRRPRASILTLRHFGNSD